MKRLNDEELALITGGEAITIATVMAILAIALATVVVYRIFVSKDGNATFPGGFKFTWE